MYFPDGVRMPLTPLVWLRQWRGGITSVAYHLRAPWNAAADEFPERSYFLVFLFYTF